MLKKKENIDKEKFIIVQVDFHYCDYLRQYDDRVPYNSGTKRNRPFIGVLFKVNGLEYFTPLSSPKGKHKMMRNAVDFVKIDNGTLGAINFNNMIPVNKESYNKINILYEGNDDKEIKYYHLLYMQLLWLNKNSDKVKYKAEKLYNNYILNKLPLNVEKRCCNFLLLEKKCQAYQKTKVSN